MYRALTNVNKVRTSRATCIQSVACQWSGMVKKHGRYTSAYDRVSAAGDSWTQINEDTFVPLRRKSGKQSRFFKYDGKCRDNSQRRPDGIQVCPTDSGAIHHADYEAQKLPGYQIGLMYVDGALFTLKRAMLHKRTLESYFQCSHCPVRAVAAPRIQFLDEYEAFVSMFEDLNGNRAC